MRKRATGAVVAGGAVAAAAMVAVGSWMARECHLPAGRAAVKAANAIGCVDFWFARYQVAVAALLLLIAALLVAWPAWRQWAEIRHQLAEVRRQSAQHAFETLRTLQMQLAEEALVVKKVELAARYSLTFEEGLEGNIDDPSYALIHEEDFEERYETLQTLERSLRDCAARTWENQEVQKARSELLVSLVEMGQALHAARQKLFRILGPFRGPHRLAEWYAASPTLYGVSVAEPARDLIARCRRLEEALDGEQGAIGRALEKATKSAFDLG